MSSLLVVCIYSFFLTNINTSVRIRVSPTSVRFIELLTDYIYRDD